MELVRKHGPWALLAAIGAGRPPPAADPQDWEQLEAWLHAALSRAECR